MKPTERHRRYLALFWLVVGFLCWQPVLLLLFSKATWSKAGGAASHPGSQGGDWTSPVLIVGLFIMWFVGGAAIGQSASAAIGGARWLATIGMILSIPFLILAFLLSKP